MEKVILPPSKRKPILYDEVKKYSKKGYKTTKQKNFSAYMVRDKSNNTVSAKQKIKWILFDIAKLIKHTKKNNFKPSSIYIEVDMYGEISVTKEV